MRRWWPPRCRWTLRAPRKPPHPRGRPPAFAARIDAALTELVAAKAEQTLARQAQAGEQIRELGILYHPYDLERGQALIIISPTLFSHGVAASLQNMVLRAQTHMGRLAFGGFVIKAAWPLTVRSAGRHPLRRRVGTFGAPRRCGRLAPTRPRIPHQAQRLTVQWLATLTFFWASVQSRVDALDLAPNVEQAVLTQLIPALYLERVTGHSTHADTRHRLTALSAQLLAPLRQPTHPLQALAPARRAQIEAVAEGCADLFQRSSSCMEGRNGYLSLYHHGSHRLSGRKLTALAAMHNFYVRRPDGTTAAERFFGRAHPALFDQVLAHIDLPSPARRRRPRPVSLPALTLVAA